MYSSNEVKSFADQTGKLSIWTNSNFGGMPSYFIYTNIQGNILGKLFLIILALPKPLYFFLISTICFYILLSNFKINSWLSIFGAIAGTFVAYNIEIIASGHETKMLSIGWYPGVLAGILMIYQNKRLLGTITLIITLALCLSLGMQQIWFYMIWVFLILAVYQLIDAIKSNQFKNWMINSAIILGVGILNLLPILSNTIPQYLYNQETMRGVPNQN